MDKAFWLARWANKEIGFHQEVVNVHLHQHWQILTVAQNTEVFVPLCGKSLDMLWLRQQGHPVLGVELSTTAAQEFFSENNLTPTITSTDKFTCYAADDIRILCGDFFDLNQDDMAQIGVVYDRASLVALPP